MSQLYLNATTPQRHSKAGSLSDILVTDKSYEFVFGDKIFMRSKMIFHQKWYPRKISYILYFPIVTPYNKCFQKSTKGLLKIMEKMLNSLKFHAQKILWVIDTSSGVAEKWSAFSVLNINLF